MGTLQTDKQTAWNLSPLFLSDTDPQIEMQQKKVEEEVIKFVRKWKKRAY